MVIFCHADDPNWVIKAPSTEAKVLNDLEWMQTLYADLEKESRKPSQIESKRIGNIYSKQSGAEKGYAGMILISYLSVENYESILRELILSENKDEMVAAVEMLSFKLSSGTKTEREKLLAQSDFENRINEIKSLEILDNYRLKQIEKLIKQFEDERSFTSEDIASQKNKVPASTQSALPTTAMKAPSVAVEETPEFESYEIAKEAPEKSSSWLLWLIGALIFLGGLAVVIRRKK